jgi:hypothetical protein
MLKGLDLVGLLHFQTSYATSPAHQDCVARGTESGVQGAWFSIMSRICQPGCIHTATCMLYSAVRT